jgi:hypothetical protein
MASVNMNTRQVVLTMNHQQAGRLLDLLAVEAKTEQWAEELFSVMNGDGGRERGKQKA